ncbi:hypothetical protein L596_002596 [Steinernema carpocapsae]|uniref:Uncharacterized protein n=1 Tax=Steinernema carpocapsae TaxID=34508 RepID=A0A4U8UQ31_STECR|nr:hypothetical protein L596_002596 [Steinernema carpocapsae]
MELWTTAIRKTRKKRRSNLEGFHLMSESSSGAAPDSMLSFNDCYEDDAGNVSANGERRSLLLKSQSLDMPASNKVGVSPQLFSTTAKKRRKTVNQGQTDQDGTVEMQELPPDANSSDFAPAFTNNNFTEDAVMATSNGVKKTFKRLTRFLR